MESILNSLKERYVDMNVFRGKPSAYVRGLIFCDDTFSAHFQSCRGYQLNFVHFATIFPTKGLQRELNIVNMQIGENTLAFFS